MKLLTITDVAVEDTAAASEEVAAWRRVLAAQGILG